MKKIKRLLNLGANELFFLAVVTALCIAMLFLMLALVDNYQEMDEIQKNINKPNYPDTPLYYKQYHGLK